MTTHLDLKYQGKSDYIKAYASFRDLTDSESTSRYLIFLYSNPISWWSHKQTTVNKSTCKAEYMAMREVCSGTYSMDKALRDITGNTYYRSNTYYGREYVGM